MTEKSRDIHGNWRDIIIGVRVSECQYNKVMELINMEGKNKREFIRNKLENSQIRCMKNRKAYLALKPYYDDVMNNMQHLTEKGRENGKDYNDQERKL